MYHKYPDNTDNMEIETSTDRWIKFDHIRDKIIKLNTSLLTVCDTWKNTELKDENWHSIIIIWISLK